MYLKALEIQGFKSFPQKTRLAFEKPVTAIVGPNGSGKSNIADAIMWVMGEQSTKNLRGGKMEDVIFGGTQTRSALNFAEVSLILDNSAHTFDVENSEVMVTRRYYRSGESEYYINKQSVRLRDINELFMDTGLGREGYSIIGQGKIDSILSAKSTDRREIFEEAVGISRFRHRKEESERKLDKAEENLLRINDKISELELQVEPLREQSEVAKKYLILRDELRGLEVSVWVENLEKLQKQNEELVGSYVDAQNRLTDARAELENLYAESEKFFDRMREQDAGAEAIRGEISEAEGRCGAEESAVAVLRNDLKNNIQNIERIKGELRQQSERDEGIEAQIKEKTDRLSAIEGEKGALKIRTEALIKESEEIDAEAGSAAEKLGELIKEKNENSAEGAREQARLASISSAMQEAEDRSAKLIADLNDAEGRLKDAQRQAEQSREELKEAGDRAQGLKNIIDGYKLRLESKRKKLKSAEDEKVKTAMELDAVRSRIALLTEMEKEYAGYSKAVKTVMQESARGTLRNIHGPVAELLKTEDKYALAIETALGGAAQNIIVGTENDGKAAISMLKRRDAGRATFLPLSTIRGAKLNERGLSDEDGFEGVASELVKYDEKFSEIYLSLLGRVVIADELDSAIRIAKKYSNRFRVVTLDGQVINAGGSMTGGSASKNAGILSRANELEKLSKREKEVAENAARAAETCQNLQREVAGEEYELSVSEDELRSFEDTVLKLETACEHSAVLIKAITDSAEALRAEKESIEASATKNALEIKAIRARMNELYHDGERLDMKIERATAGNDAIAAKKQTLLDGIYEIRAEEASLDAEREAVEKTVGELEKLRLDLTGGKERQEGVISDYEKRNLELRSEIEAKTRNIGAIEKEIAGLREKLGKKTEEKLELEAQRTRHDKLTQEKNAALLELERESARIEQKKTAAEMEESQIVEKLWDTYELSRSSAMQVRMELESHTAAVRRIGELKREIGKLGTPNIGAIDEFERVNTRYTFLAEQRDDIEKSRSELLGIIGDITGEMCEIFTGGLKHINESFKETFTELFGGGRADLELEDPENVLESGIEIRVQPPGKSLKTITLLSGGEKAFVAIALYFAILKIKPTPFVVMDEIEAALDEANVTRYASYMRRLSGNTQFVIITHRRNTMEEADVLYGVTMQEQGVSQILNVDLDEAEKTIGKSGD